MGRSKTSCFKIISCGCINDSVDRDEIDVSSENKGDNKPGWSSRKKSPTRQEPSNTVITEKIASSDNKEIPEPITISSEPQTYSNISEKSSDNIWTEDIPNSVTKNATVSTTVIKSVCEEDDIKCEPDPDESKSKSESAVLVIQAAVRRFLAERRLVKHKNVVKLQAAVRGHLVRNHAVGTLRCVQAIVKMQALVRARKETGVQNTGINSTPTHISIEKLLSNRLARQLLESTPKTKQINIKCDPLKSDSAWNWLERWMSASSPETLESHTPDHDQDKDVNNMKNEVKMVIFANNVGEASVRFEEKQNMSNNEDDSNVIIREENPISDPTPENITSETKPDPSLENILSETKPDPIPENIVSETKPVPIPENPESETKPDLVPEILVSETKPESISEKPVSETDPKPDLEGRKYVFGSRKASNPAFIAAQSRFEELTSPKTNPLKSPNSSNQHNEPVSGAENGSSDPFKSAKPSNQDDVAGSGSYSPADIGSSDQLKPDNEPDNEATVVKDVEPVNHGSRGVQNGGSEYGTELSITSALDSQDQPEIENKKFSNEAVGDVNNNINVVITEEQIDQKPDNIDYEPDPELNHYVYNSNEPETVLQSESPNVYNSNEPEPVLQSESSNVYNSNKPEPEPVFQSESPRGHITPTLESQGTPSSEISTTTKKPKTNKKASGQSPKSWSTSKKSSPVRSVDSGLRTSLEQLPKDPKPVKRRNYPGSPKPDEIDHEPVVPSYMQATESARAKAVSNSSPRSSPDVQESYLKKRQSLPGSVNGRQGSPRVQRSMSQALQTTKGNGSQERKWQR